MKTKKTIYILIALIILSSFVINGFEYSIYQSKSYILSNMNLTITLIRSEGYSSARVEDIYAEAVIANAEDFYYTASVFKNTSKLYEDSKNKLINYKGQIEFLLVDDANIIENIELAESLINKGKYEEALEKLDIVSNFLGKESNTIFTELKSRVGILKTDFKLLNKTTSVFSTFETDLNYANSKEDVIELDSLKQTLDNINNSINILSNTYEFLNYFSKKDILQKKLNDYYDEMLFNFNKQRFDRINSIYTEVFNEYNTALKYEKQFNLTEQKINELSEKSYEVKDFRTMLYDSYNYYQKAEFETALLKLNTLDEGILDFESSNIVSFDKSFSLISFFKQKWKEVLVVFFIAFVVIFLVSKKLKKYYVKKRIKSLKQQKTAIVEMIIKSQTDYYDTKLISKKLYIQKSLQYQKKLVKITRELALLQSDAKTN